MRDVPSKTPPGHREWASAALKAVFAQENRESAMAKAGTVAGETEERKLKAAANRLREGVGETAACLLPGFPANHGIKPRTDNMIERLNREIRRRTRVVGGFPDSDSALMLVCAGIATSPHARGRTGSTWTCPGSTTTQAQRHESHANSWPTTNLRKKADTTDR